MSEQEQTSQLSALFDGELPSQQAELVIRRALKDAAMRQRWQSYALIGACVRGEPLAGAGRAGSLADRVSARIASEAEILAPWGSAATAQSAADRNLGRFFGRGAMGGAIAAGVAVLAVFVVRSIGSVDPSSAGQLLVQDNNVRDVAPALVADNLAGLDDVPRSYTTPVASTRVASPMVDAQPLAHYVVAHSEQAALSMGFTYDLTEGAELMTADEIEAHLR